MTRRRKHLASFSKSWGNLLRHWNFWPDIGKNSTTDFSLSLNPNFTPIQCNMKFCFGTTITFSLCICLKVSASTIQIHCNVFISIWCTGNYIEQCNSFQTSGIQLWCKFGIELVHSSVLTALSCLSAQCYIATMIYTTEYTNVTHETKSTGFENCRM